jgi:nucleotide-binding universal stress UspA family protein
MKILIGYDGSEYSDFALDDLQRAGLPAEADVFVATIAEMWIQMPLSYGGVETGFVDETVSGKAQASEIASKGVERLRKSFPQWRIEGDATVGSPSENLLSKADDWKPDLIVVGSQSRGAVGRFFFGSVAQSLLDNALCSVRIGRKPAADAVPTKEKHLRLIVGVDGSEGAEAAVDSIISRQWDARCEICVVSAIDYVVPLIQFDSGAPPPTHHSVYYLEEFEKAEKNVNRAVNKLDGAGFSTVAVIRNQDPKSLLIEQAKERKADCLFVGAKGKSRIERLLIGSVSSSVASRAECTVEVARPKL